MKPFQTEPFQTVTEPNRVKPNRQTVLTPLDVRYLLEDKSWPQKYSAVIANIFRKVARQEASDAVQRFALSNPRSFPSQIDPYESRPYKLQFEANIRCKLFTGNKVEAEGLSPVKVRLLDAVSGDPITDGPFSSEKVEIVPLQGHFDAEQLKEWTKEDFCTHMAYQRNNKGSLLVGQCMIALCKGVGFVDNICFTDNSSWGRSKKFRLGARVVAKEDHVREAVSNAFQVKDRRGENYEKHDFPSLEDEVWRLRWIAKNGKICKKLKENQIYKVKDFITFYQNDESLLRRIMKVSPKKWKEIIKHAESCFKGNDACTNLNNSAQINIPIESYAGEHSHQEHQLHDHSMGWENSLLKNSFIDSLEDVCLSSLCYSMPPPSNTMLDGLTSSNVMLDGQTSSNAILDGQTSSNAMFDGHTSSNAMLDVQTSYNTMLNGQTSSNAMLDGQISSWLTDHLTRT